MPESWRTPAYLSPPGPAAEYGHSMLGIGRSPLPPPTSVEAAWLQFHQCIAHQHSIGVDTFSKKSSRRAHDVEMMRIPEITLQAFAGTPVVGIMMKRTPRVFSTVVSLFSFVDAPEIINPNWLPPTAVCVVCGYSG